ncbi:MAG TPA: response regulator [Candidatus Angelobacter sp.]
MAAMKLLFVDDESGIRLTLPMILEQEGFVVKTAASVREAIELINREAFDILISDLNIGQPGDGFTVVSVMRRVQPDAVTFILTGYPDFESAIQAIRSQVDDYITKPADIPSLVAALKHKLENRNPVRRVVARRAPVLILENLPELLQGWLVSLSRDVQLRNMLLDTKDRIDNFPEILAGVCGQVMNGSLALDEPTATYAAQHGVRRFRRGYRAEQILTEARLLQRRISCFLQENLLAIDLSTLISDVMNIADLLSVATEESIRSFNTQLQVA